MNPSQTSVPRARRAGILTASIAALLAGAAQVTAQTLYWDPNLATPGAQGGSGVWNAGNFWWDSTANVAWVSGADAVFDQAQGAAVANVDVGGMVLDDLTFGSVGSYNLYASSGVLTFAQADGTHVIQPSSGFPFTSIAASMAGTGDLLFQGGIIDLRGNNTYVGATRISSGGQVRLIGGNAIPDSSLVAFEGPGNQSTLTVYDNEVIGGLSGSGVVNLQAILSVGANNNDTTFDGLFTGIGSLVKVGTGTLSIKTANYTGSTTINGGTLAVSSGSAIPHGAVIGAAGTLKLLSNQTVSSLDGEGVVELAAGNITVGSGTFSGVIRGTGSLVKSTAGTLTLTGANTFTGNIQIAEGTLSVPDFTPLSTGQISLSGPFTSNFPTLNFSAGSFSSNRALLLGAVVQWITVSNAGTVVTLNGPISGGELATGGAGTVVLGNPANTFGGGILINSGTLSISDVADVGVASPIGNGGSISISGFLGSTTTGRVSFTGASDQTNRSVAIGVGGGIIDVQQAATQLGLNGNISGSGTLTKVGAGTLALGGANSRTGVTKIEEGTLSFLTSGAFGGSAGVNVSASGTMKLLADGTIGALTGNGVVDLTAGSLTLSISTDASYAGSFTGSGKVIKRGTATQTFTGTANHSGGTSVLEGTLSVPAFASVGSGPFILGGTSTVGTLAISGLSIERSEGIEIAPGGGAIAATDAAALISLNGPITGAGALTLTGPGAFTLGSGNNSFLGAVSIRTVVAVSDIADSGLNSSLGAGGVITLGTSNAGGRLNFVGSNDSSNRNITIGTAGAVFDVQQAASQIILSGVISGSGLTKLGPGTLALFGVNTFSGGTSINSGTLAVGGGNAISNSTGIVVGAQGTLKLLADETIGSLSGAGIVDIGVSTLTLGTGSSTTFTGAFIGTGNLVKDGTGTLTLAGSNSFTGGISILRGTLAVDNFATLGSGHVSLGGATTAGSFSYSGVPVISSNAFDVQAGGGVFILTSPATSVTLGGVIGGAGGVTFAAGTGRTIIVSNSANSFSGNVTLGGGALSVADVADGGLNSPLGAGSTILFQSNSRMVYNGSGDDSSNRQLSYSGFGAIEVAQGVTLTLPNATGSSGFTKAGPGTLVQTNPSNNFSGNVTIAEGVLITGALANSGLPSALGSGIFIALGGSTTVGQLSLPSGAVSSTNRGITVGAGGGVLALDGGQVTLSGTISGTGSLTFRGTSALTSTAVLAGGNTLNGDIALDKVKLRTTTGNNVPDLRRVILAGNGGAWLAIEMAEVIGSLEGNSSANAGRVTLSAALTTGGDNSDSTYAGVVEGPGKLTKTGLGTFSLTGANTFSGGLKIINGALAVIDVNNTGLPGPLGVGDIEIGNSLGSPRLRFDGIGTRATNRVLSLTDSGGGFDVSNPSGTLIWSGQINGGGLAQLFKDGPGTLRLTGANGFGGPVSINAGVLQIFAGNAIPNTGLVTIAQGASLDILPGANEVIGQLGGAGEVRLGGQRLTIGNTGASSTFSGLISGSGASSLEKTGGGTLTLTNTGNSFTGGVSISDGAISVPTIANSGINSPLGREGGITLGDDGHIGRLIVTSPDDVQTTRGLSFGAGGGVLEVSSPSVRLTLAGDITGSSSLLKLGAGMLHLLGDKSFGGSTFVAEGELNLEGSLSGSVTVISPGILENTGLRTVGRIVLASGTLSPAGENLAGQIATSALVLQSGNLSLDFDSAAPGGYDSIKVAGPVEFEGALSLDIDLGFDPQDHVDSFTLVENDGNDPVVLGPGAFMLTPSGPRYNHQDMEVTSNGYTQYFRVEFGGEAGDNDFKLIAVPEPGSAILLLGASVLFAGRRRRAEERSPRKTFEFLP